MYTVFSSGGLVYLFICFTLIGSILPYPIYLLRMVSWNLYAFRFGDWMIGHRNDQLRI